MKYIIDHDLHIHSFLSSCSNDKEQNPVTILNYAKKSNLNTICLTNHYWDDKILGSSEWYRPQNFDHLSKALPLPNEEGISFLFGCETELNKDLILAMPKSRFDDFDFVIIPTTHLHMDINISKEDANSDKRRAELWVKRLDAVLNMDLPFEKIGIAHLACHLINKNGHIPVLDLITDVDMRNLFNKAARLGVGIEINSGDFKVSEDEIEHVLRIFKIAKECGCKFYLGSDAHHPNSLYGAIPYFEKAINLLNLTEEDKFHIIKRI